MAVHHWPAFPLFRFLAALFVFALAGFTARAADDLGATLQRGLFEEEANNNLDAAIKAYESVVTVTDAQRKLAGTALFRLAECYRKLGRTNDAAAHYQRVLREFPDQHLLADLARHYVVEAAPTSLGATLSSERVRLLENELVMAQAEAARRSTLYAQLTNRTPVELRQVLPSTSPDQLLNTLQDQLAGTQQRLTELQFRYSKSHPEVKSAISLVETINRQINDRIEGVLAGLKLKAEAQEAAVIRLRRQLDEARTAATADTAAPTSRAARAEQKRLFEEEIKILEIDLAGLERLKKEGTVNQGALSSKQRELLALRRQLAALSDTVPGETGTPATDEEDKEVRRIQALIKDSPDLINAGDQSGSTPLHKAASAGQLVVARFLLASKADVNARRAGNLTPLHDAVEMGRKSMAELLLASGADVNAAGRSGWTPLHYAANRGFKSIVELLLAYKANPNARDDSGGTSLHAAVEKGFKSVVETLLAGGADVNVVKNGSGFTSPGSYGWDLRGRFGTALHEAAYSGDKSITESLLANGADANLLNPFGETPLHVVAAGDNVALASLLVNAKANVNARIGLGDAGLTPLCQAVVSGRAEMVEFLLKNGADPNVVFSDGQPNPNVNTPLTAALHSNTLNERERIVAALLEFKANPNVKEGRGYAPLHLSLFSSFGGRTNLADLLLKHGADVDARDPQGDTGLAWLSSGKALKEFLLNYKANPNTQNTAGDTPLHKLVQTLNDRNLSSQKELAELLIAHGADVNLRNQQGFTPLNLFGVPARPSNPFATELAEVLRKHGAKDEQLDLVADPDSIRVWRKGMPFGRVVFVRDAAGRNRFTLMEAILNFYSFRYMPLKLAPQPAAQTSLPQPASALQRGIPERRMISPPPAPLPGGLSSGGTPASNYDPLSEIPFPDLTRIRILRLVDAAKNEKKVISANLINAAGIVLCANDVVLEFGDIIEIPEREYRLDEGRSSLTGDQNKQFLECLPRKILVTVKQEGTEVKLLPLTTMAYLSAAMKQGHVRTVLRSTSDLSKLRITRRADAALGQEARDWTVDLEASQGSGRQQWDDLWLRDGDVVEVPEKGQ